MVVLNLCLRFITMKMRQLRRLLLFWCTLYLQTPDGSAVTVNWDVSDTSSKVCREIQMKKWNTLEIKPEITVSVVSGNAAELQCRNETGEGKPYIYIFCLSFEFIYLLSYKCVLVYLSCRMVYMVADPIWIIRRKIQV